MQPSHVHSNVEPFRLNSVLERVARLPSATHALSVVAPPRSVSAITLAAIAAFATPSTGPAAAQAPCDSTWLPGFGEMAGVIYGGIVSMAWFDDGTGPQLIVGGDFQVAGRHWTKNVARFDGERWWPMGERTSFAGPGLNGRVNALIAFDDGSGPAVYAGGAFTATADDSVALGRIAKWNGAEWKPVGDGAGGFASGTVHCFAIHDDGTGEKLYVGGHITPVGGTPIAGVARWENGTWAPVGDGPFGIVRTLHVHDDGAGAALYAGGSIVGGGATSQSKNVSKWDGTAWTTLGDGLQGGGAPLEAGVYALASGPFGTDGAAVLVAGGPFTVSGDQTVASLATWDGALWHQWPQQAPVSRIHTILVDTLSDPSNPRVLIGGKSGPTAAPRVAAWEDGAWDLLDGGVNAHSINASVLGPAPDATPAKRDWYVGGGQTLAGGVGSRGVSIWSADGWRRVGGGLAGPVRAIAGGDAVDEPHLLVAGAFGDLEPGANANGFARWGADGWGDVEGETIGAINTFERGDDLGGAGDALYAGGAFTRIGGVDASRLAQRVNGGWMEIGGGVDGAVRAVLPVERDHFGGPALYVGGAFTSVGGGIEAQRIARWDGTTWMALGEGLDGVVEALAWHDDGSGPALYAAGAFANAGGAPAARIARWDGTAWTPLLWSGNNGLPSGTIRALRSFDDGNGTRLYVAGAINLSFGGVPCHSIVRWTGATMEPVGGCVTVFSMPDAGAWALVPHDFGAGTVLVAVGVFWHFDAEGNSATGVATWDGVEWRSWPRVESPFIVHAYTGISTFDPFGGEPILAIGGEFVDAIGANSNMARFGCAPSDAPDPDLNGDGVVDGADVAILLAAWGTDDAAADLNADGIVDGLDLGILLNAWSGR